MAIDAPGVMTLTANPHKGGFVPGVQFLSEFVFTRTIYNDSLEMAKHGAFLKIAKDLYEKGVLRSLVSDEENVLPFTVEALRKGQELMEKGSAIGKVVLAVGGEEGGRRGGGGARRRSVLSENVEGEGPQLCDESVSYCCAFFELWA